MEDHELSYEDIATLLDAKADKLADSDEPEAVLRDILETLGRAESIRTRTKEVDLNGRVSIGRDKSHTPGLTIFHTDPEEQGEDGEDTGDGE